MITALHSFLMPIPEVSQCAFDIKITSNATTQHQLQAVMWHKYGRPYKELMSINKQTISAIY